MNPCKLRVIAGFIHSSTDGHLGIVNNAAMNTGLQQLWDIYTMEYYSATIKKEILSFVTEWMDLENIMLSELSQSEKDKYHMISLICGI